MKPLESEDHKLRKDASNSNSASPSAQKDTIPQRSHRLRGLRRPHNISSLVQPLNTAQQLDTPRLAKLINIADLIVRRNKNQHRSQLFFKHLTLLRSALRKLHTVRTELVKLGSSGASRSTAIEIRARFEAEAKFRSQRDVLEEHIREILIPKCYVSFSGLVADAQFANLGVVLIGLLADIAAGSDGLGLPKYNAVEEGSHGGGHVSTAKTQIKDYEEMLGVSTRITGEDQGEVVERIYSASPQPLRLGFEESVEGLDEERGEGNSEVGTLVEGLKSNQGLNMLGENSQIEPRTTVRQKKTKKKRGALDDIFSGLM